MSQEDVFNILKELGGEATTEQIRKKARVKYPKRTLYLYVLNRLRKLEKDKQILFIRENWRIIKKNVKD